MDPDTSKIGGGGGVISRLLDSLIMMVHSYYIGLLISLKSNLNEYNKKCRSVKLSQNYICFNPSWSTLSLRWEVSSNRRNLHFFKKKIQFYIALQNLFNYYLYSDTSIYSLFWLIMYHQVIVDSYWFRSLIFHHDTLYLTWSFRLSPSTLMESIHLDAGHHLFLFYLSQHQSLLQRVDLIIGHQVDADS